MRNERKKNFGLPRWLQFLEPQFDVASNSRFVLRFLIYFTPC